MRISEKYNIVPVLRKPPKFEKVNCETEKKTVKKI